MPRRRRQGACGLRVKVLGHTLHLRGRLVGTVQQQQPGCQVAGGAPLRSTALQRAAPGHRPAAARLRLYATACTKGAVEWALRVPDRRRPGPRAAVTLVGQTPPAHSPSTGQPPSAPVSSHCPRCSHHGNHSGVSALGPVLRERWPPCSGTSVPLIVRSRGAAVAVDALAPAALICLSNNHRKVGSASDFWKRANHACCSSRLT